MKLMNVESGQKWMMTNKYYITLRLNCSYIPTIFFTDMEFCIILPRAKVGNKLASAKFKQFLAYTSMYEISSYKYIRL